MSAIDENLRVKPRPAWPGPDEPLAFVEALFPTTANGFVETRCLRDGEVLRRDFEAIKRKREAMGVNFPPADVDLFIGVAPRSRKEGTKAAVEEVWAVWVDLDRADATDVLERFEPQPALVVATGTPGHLQAYWPLTEPAAPHDVERVNRALAVRLGGDRAVADASRMMRLPGSLNCKHHPAVRARLVSAGDQRFTLAELEEALAEAQDPGEAQPGPGADDEPSEPVQRVLGALSGVKRSGSGWQALCPAHDDHRPSLSIREGGDGRCLLHCFRGCEVRDVVSGLGLRMSDLFPGESHAPSVAAELVAIAKRQGAELFHDPAQRAFASIPVDGHREIVGVTSSAFRRWLRRHFHHEQGRVANSQAIADAVDLLCAIAEFEGEEREVFARVASHDGAVVIDLADEEWRAVAVRPGAVELLDRSPVAFIRGPATVALPEPAFDGSIDELRDFLNLPAEPAWRLLVAFLVAALVGHGPFVILILQGEKGSGKSTSGRVIRAVVDPAHPALRGGARDERELMIAARTSWLVAFDNLSGLSQRLSDSLCRLSTGAGFGTRRLYTDDEEVVFHAMRPILLNGIADIATRPDLLSRSIVLELPMLDEETTAPEADFYDRLEEARPRIFGALLSLAAEVLAILPEVELDRSPRMADFARIGVAVEQARGWPDGSFLAAYRGQQADAYGAALDSDPLAPVLLKFMEQGAQQTGWTGTATELLGKLTNLADDEVTYRRNWPASASSLGKRLKELLPALRPTGLVIEWVRSGRGTTKQRGLSIFWDARDGDGGDGGDG
jgi:RepB DNA-primase from phage plasmid